MPNKDRELVTGDKEIADELNSFFSSVFTREDLQNVPDPEMEVISEPMALLKFTQQMIRNKIKKLRKEAAPGPHGITPGLLQNLREAVLLPLEIIYNMSMEKGESPEEW